MTDIYDQLKNLSPEKRELLELMLKEKGVDLLGAKIVSQGRENNKFPISFGQQRLWFLDQLDPGTPLYNNPAAVILKGKANIPALEKALNEIVQRHEVLRTTFAMENDQPIQVIDAEMPIKLEQIDLRHLPASEREQEAMRIAKEEAQKPFDLTTGPLFRVTLLQLADQEYFMILVMHHIVSDGWSLSIFIQEVAILYKVLVAGHPSPLPELQVQYADFAHWQRQWMQGKVLEDQLSYWREQLRDAPPVLNLPLDHPRPGYQSTNGRTHFFDFPDHLRQAIDAMAKQEDVTLFMIVLAAFNALLFRYTGQADICVGTPIAGRNRRETESLIGFFVNTLVMRADLSGNPTIRDLLKRVKNVAVGAYGHQDIPFETLVEKLQPERDMAISPFFQVMFVHLDTTTQTLKLPDITIEPRQIDSGTAKFDLTFVIEENEEKLAGQIVYNTDLFEPATIERMAAQFQVLFDGMVKDVERRISELPLISESEQVQILENWSRAPQEFYSPQSKSIGELFEAQVKKASDEIALIYENEKLNYQELNERANRLAHHLMDYGVAPEALVGICLEQPMDMIISLLAIFKAGGAHLPLDPAYPKERLAFMIEDSAVPAIITEDNLLELLPDNGSRKICLNRDQEMIAKQSKKNPTQRAAVENLAYVIYTSGSTGKPKGVMISHGAIADHCLNMKDYYELKATDHVLQFASMNFDASLEQILPTLISGAKLVLRGTEIWSPREFQQNISNYGLTVVNPPTAYWHQLLHEWDGSDISNKNGQLRLFIVGGDLMSAENLQLWEKTALNSAKLLNAYGPTEATITSTTFEVPANFKNTGLSQGFPIGQATPLRLVYVLDQFF
ncbi:MAG: condensation domain-containing protein, partial [bacterium]|nr:condensation domain-containing protein [bacterium]